MFSCRTLQGCGQTRRITDNTMRPVSCALTIEMLDKDSGIRKFTRMVRKAGRLEATTTDALLAPGACFVP